MSALRRVNSKELPEDLSLVLDQTQCRAHLRPLVQFCSLDQVCICSVCLDSDHKGHPTVLLQTELDRRKSALHRVQAQTQDQLELRRRKLQEFNQVVEQSRTQAQTETDLGLKAFRALLDQVQAGLDRFLVQVEDQQQQTQRQVQELVQELDQEISVIEERKSEVDRLIQTEDHLQVLQTEIGPEPVLKDWTHVVLEPVPITGTAAAALSQVHTRLNPDLRVQTGSDPFTTSLDPDLSLQKVQDFAVDLTLDPDSAFHKLVLSEDLKQVYHSEAQAHSSPARPSPARFSFCPCVLAKESFSSGCFYFEVQVRGKTKWTLGVARDSMNRKGQIRVSPKRGQWTLSLREQTQYSANTGPAVALNLESPLDRIGVYVNYDRGLVCFYNVDSEDLLYAFKDCDFGDRLRPYFNPCENEGGANKAPLVLTRVQTKPRPNQDRGPK